MGNKVWCICILALLANMMLSCKSVNNKPIAFSMHLSGSNSNIPLIRITLENGIPLDLIFDTGGAEAVLYDSGLKKIASINDQEIKTQKRSEFNCINAKAGQHTLKSLHFVYDPMMNEGYDQAGVDGLIGLVAFADCRTVTIDYFKNKISIDTEKLIGAETPLYKDPIVDNFYDIDIELEGRHDRAVIDTGNNYLILRKDYDKDPKGMSEEEIADFIFNGNVQLTPHQDINVGSLKIGGKEFTNLKGVYASDSGGRTSQNARNVFTLYNSIGYSVFRNHIIQINFEENVFIIQ